LLQPTTATGKSVFGPSWRVDPGRVAIPSGEFVAPVQTPGEPQGGVAQVWGAIQFRKSKRWKMFT
jgi:hypothetical protein